MKTLLVSNMQPAIVAGNGKVELAKRQWKLKLLVSLVLLSALCCSEAQSCTGNGNGSGNGNGGISCTVQYQVSEAGDVKCTFPEYTNLDTPRIHYYHNQTTHSVYYSNNSNYGTNGGSGYLGNNSLDGGGVTVTPGPYSYVYIENDDVTQYEHKAGDPTCTYTNWYVGQMDYSGNVVDMRSTWSDSGGPCSSQGWDEMIEQSDDLKSNPALDGRWNFTEIQTNWTFHLNYFDECGASCTNCVDTWQTSNQSLCSTAFIDAIVTNLTPIEKDCGDMDATNSLTGSPDDGTNYVFISGTMTMTLDTEYTDQELYTNIMGLQPGYSGAWNSDGDFWSSVAYSAIAASHADGTGWTTPSDAELQEMQYRFDVPSSQLLTEYQISWDVITYDIWQGVLNTSQNQTNIIGNGGDAYSAIYDVQPPWWDQSDYGGFVFTFIANVQISIVPQNTALVGNGPDWGVPGNGNGCSACNGAGSAGGRGSTSGGIYAAFSMGRADAIHSAGSLRIWSAQTNSALATPSALSITTAATNVEIIQANSQLRQVNAPQALADIVVNDAYSYSINYYLPAQVGPLAGGVHLLSGAPFLTWKIINPDGGNACNRLQLTETNGSQVSVYECDNTGAAGNWKYEYPGGLREDEVDTTNTDTAFGWTTTVSWASRVPGGPDQYKMMRVYDIYMANPQTMGSGMYDPMAGPFLVQETLDPDNHPKTTTYTYDLYGYANGTTVPLTSVTYPDGYWEQYYQFDNQGRPWGKYSSLLNVAFQNSGSANQTTYDYYPQGVFGFSTTDDGTMSPNTPRGVVQEENGLSLSTYTMFPNHYTRLDCAPTQGGFWDSGNLITTNNYYSTGLNSNRLESVQRPDGTMQIYTYAQASDGSQTNIVFSGVPNSADTAIVDGTETITIVGPVGQMVSRTQIDIASGIITSRETYSNYDQFSRPQCVTYLDGTSNVTIYACCGVDTTVDRDGVPTYYEYDAAKRLVATTRLGITTSYSLDSLGHVLKTTRTGTDSSAIILSQAEYDLSGQLIAETNALGGVTTYNVSSNAFGGLMRTTTYPDGGTRVEQYNLDRSLASVSGTAVHGKGYGYGTVWAPYMYWPTMTACSYVVETNLDNAGNPTPEWTANYTDIMGRNVETFYPGLNSHGSVSYYSGIGQLTNQVDADGVSTIYQYDAKGELAYTAVDMDLDGVIDFGGTDHITWTTNDVLLDHGTAVTRSRTFVWLDGQSSGTLSSVSETSTDGLRSWQINYRDANTAVTNQISTCYYGTGHTVTNTAPDGSYAVNTYTYGQLTCSTRYDSTGAQIGSTSYGYDAHGREYQVTDARNGTTTYGYNNADQVTSVTTPNPGGGSPETTTTLYDIMLRPYSIIQPDGTTVNSIYLLTGELAMQYGSRTYPVGYGYDYAGRMQTMTNWSSFNSLAGARVTTWNYDSQRGWLCSKAYADGNGPSYAYTPAGRLQGRTWVRTDGNGNPVTTTYAYDNAGSLTNTLYSDSTPSVTNSYDRLGRLTQQSTPNYQLNSSYSLAGQLLSESFVGGPLAGLSVTNNYDSLMRRTRLAVLNASASPLATTAYGYDAASRLLGATNVNDGDTATYSYLANSPLVGQIIFKNNGVTRMTTSKTYDYLNRLTQISSAPTASGTVPVSFNYSYNPANQRTKDALADGSYWLYGYDALGQVISGCKYFRDGTPVPGQQFGYLFDDIGNRMQTEAGGDQTGGDQRLANYSVNILNQITLRDYPGTNDVIGAALATNGVSVNGQAAWRKGEYFWSTVKTNNQSGPAWLGITVASGGSSTLGNVYLPQEPELFQYDPDGNLTNDGRWAYTWDAENRLIGMTVNPNVGPQYQLSFAYDARGRRIQKIVATGGVAISTNNFLYDGWNLVAELTPNNTLIRNYLWGNDLSGSMQGAGGVGGLLEVSYCGYASTNCFPAFDGNGNVAALVNAADGTTLANYEYGPFGEVIRQTGPMATINPIRFSTKYQDDESDLLYYGYRYYKASTGAWVNRDSISESGGRNIYAFVGNNPVGRIDVLGQMLYVHNSQPNPNDIGCGRWRVEKQIEDGIHYGIPTYIIQEVTVSFHATKYFGGMPFQGYSYSDDYWEAFGPFYDFDNIAAADIWFYDPGLTDVSNSSGSETQTGIAKLFSLGTTGYLGTMGQPGPIGWMPPADQMSGDLPSTKSKPSWWDNPDTPPMDGPTTSSALFIWNCSCASTSTSLLLTPTPGQSSH